ncbi:hypothetical protein [Sporosarcina sp. FSL K6-3457]|uniref:hypothetical protein n=1 Tax=Sporosarcina sp. FSL K6-3457 TaxID=2978204 RepID=UPI0030F6284C
MEVKMDREEFMEHLRKNGEYDCTCFVNPPCTFCTDGVEELYQDYLYEEEE